MSLTSWLRLSKTHNRRVPKPRPRRMLAVEALEDRNLLSSGWVNTAAGGTYNVYDLAVDSGGPGHAAAVYVTGEFTGTTDFHGGLSDGKLTSVNGVVNLFLAQYGSDGTFQWARQIGGPGGERGQSVAVDSAGNVSVTGYLTGQVTVGPAAGLTASGSNSDVLVARFDPAGNLAWAKALGGTGSDVGYGIAADDAGVYVTGGFAGTANFGGVSLTSAGAGSNIFVTRLDPASGDTVYASRAGGNTSGSDRGNAIAVDAGHNAYVAGWSYGQADFGATVLSNPLHVLSKVDAGGQFVWAQAAGVPLDTTVDRASGAVYLTTANGVTRFDGDGQTVWERNFVTCSAICRRMLPTPLLSRPTPPAIST